MPTDEKTSHDAQKAQFEEHSRRITEWLLEAQTAVEVTSEPKQEDSPSQRKAA